MQIIFQSPPQPPPQPPPPQPPPPQPHLRNLLHHFPLRNLVHHLLLSYFLLYDKYHSVHDVHNGEFKQKQELHILHN